MAEQSSGGGGGSMIDLPLDKLLIPIDGIRERKDSSHLASMESMVEKGEAGLITEDEFDSAGESIDEFDVDAVVDMIDLDDIAKVSRTKTDRELLQSDTVHSLFQVQRRGFLKISFSEDAGLTGSATGSALAKHTTIPVEESTTVGMALERISKKREVEEGARLEMCVDGAPQNEDVKLDRFMREGISHTFEIRLKRTTALKSGADGSSAAASSSSSSIKTRVTGLSDGPVIQKKRRSITKQRSGATSLFSRLIRSPIVKSESDTTGGSSGKSESRSYQSPSMEGSSVPHSGTPRFAHRSSSNSSEEDAPRASALASLAVVSTKIVSDATKTAEYKEREVEHKIERMLKALPDEAYRVTKIFTMVNQTRILRIRSGGIENVIPSRVLAAAAAVAASAVSAVSDTLVASPSDTIAPDALDIRRRGGRSCEVRKTVSDGTAAAKAQSAEYLRRKAAMLEMLKEASGKVTARNDWSEVSKVYLSHSNRFQIHISERNGRNTTRIYESEDEAGTIVDSIQKRLDLIRRVREESKREDLELRYQRSMLANEIKRVRQFNVGDTVRLTGHKVGVIEWIGTVEHAPGTHYRIKLTEVENDLNNSDPSSSSMDTMGSIKEDDVIPAVSSLPMSTESFDIGQPKIKSVSTLTSSQSDDHARSAPSEDGGSADAQDSAADGDVDAAPVSRVSVVEILESRSELVPDIVTAESIEKEVALTSGSDSIPFPPPLLIASHSRTLSKSRPRVGQVVIVSASQLVRKIDKAPSKTSSSSPSDSTEDSSANKSGDLLRSSLEESIFGEIRHMILSPKGSAGRSRADFQKKLANYVGSETLLSTVREFMNALCEFIQRKYGESYTRRIRSSLKRKRKRAAAKKEGKRYSDSFGLHKASKLQKTLGVDGLDPSSSDSDTSSDEADGDDGDDHDLDHSIHGSSDDMSDFEDSMADEHPPFTAETVTDADEVSSKKKKKETKSKEKEDSRKWKEMQDTVMIHDKVNEIIESAVEVSILRPNMDFIFKCCQRYTLKSEVRIAKQLRLLYDKQQSFFGIPKLLINKSEWNLAVYELTLFQDKQLPSEMIAALLNAAKAVFECHRQDVAVSADESRKDSFIAGDDMLPILIFVFVKASQKLDSPVFTETELMIMNGLICPSDQKSEPGYYLAVFHACVEWICAYKPD